MALYGRDTPPSVQDGRFGWEPDYKSAFSNPDVHDTSVLDDSTATKLARECYESSTNWINASRRSAWTDAERAVQGQHPSGSKYLSSEYRTRSNLYRPKTRAMVRKAEAHTASAFFSNEDVVSITPIDADDSIQKASADLIQRLLQYRLASSDPKVTVPWFLTLIGARQDCDVLGVCIAKAYWRFSEKFSHTETEHQFNDDTGAFEPHEYDVNRVIEDRPCVDLIPPENFRIEPGADWRDPINTSPYIIENIPMYVNDILLKQETGEWVDVPVSQLRSATDIEDRATRQSRELQRVPGKDHDAWKPRPYDICWIHFNIMRWGDQDWCYYTVGNADTLLSKPKKIEEVFLHGLRPYVMGFTIPEAHKTYPASKTMLIRDLQRATNDEMNLRFDGLKLSLQPRQFVRQGAGTNPEDLRLFAPGKMVFLANPKEDIVWDRPPEVTQAAYAEQDRINLDFDELVGDFSNTSVQAAQQEQTSATGMHLMTGIASSMSEYEMHCFATTFVEPLIRLLVKLEQAYETDPIVLAMAGKQAGLIQKYGINEITDELLNQSLTTKVNVGIGATNPQLKLKNFVQAGDILSKMYGPALIPGTNFQEICKEVMSLLGYRDGSRFFTPGYDPRVAALQQQLEQLQGKQKQGQGAQPDPYRVQAESIKARAETERAHMETQADLQKSQGELQLEREKEQAENWRTQFKAQHEGQQSMRELAMQHQTELARQQHDQQFQMQHTNLQHQHGMQQAHMQHQQGLQTQAVQHQHGMQQQEHAQMHQAQMEKQRAVGPVQGAVKKKANG